MNDFRDIYNHREIYELASSKADAIFEEANELYSYNDIINGVKDGFDKNMYAVDPSTFRGFHRESYAKSEGIKVVEIYRRLFLREKDNVLSKLKTIISVDELNDYEDCLGEKLITDLSKPIRVLKEDKYSSYNRFRKVIDLTIEHLVSMSNELAKERQSLLDKVFLPLDSQIFGSEYVFSDDEIDHFRLSRNTSYGAITSKEQYTMLQKYLREKACRISEEIAPFKLIYFDLFWGGRVNTKNTANLFHASIL